MKRLFLVAAAVIFATLSVSAQIKIQSPHPDLEVEITRCSGANGTVIIDMVITNFGREENINFNSRNINIYDDEGNAYNTENARILFGLTGSGMETNKTYTFPQDLPLKFRLQIDDVSPRASKLTLLKVGMSSNGLLSLVTRRPLTIHNVEWDK